MTAFDDERAHELATLLALDALEPHEQADAELRMGTFPPGTAETAAALAELVVTRPPADLAAATLERAFARRTPGRPIDAVVRCSPEVGFHRTIADLLELLQSLTDAEWDAAAHPEHGRVHDLVAHLVGMERLAARWLDPDDDVGLVPDHVAATRPAVDELAGVDPQRLIRTWHTAALQVAAAAAAGDPAREVSFHDLRTTVGGFLIIRTFELWAHAMDIAAATGRPLLRLDPERMATLSAELMAVVPLALAYRGTAVADTSVRFVLTGSAGGSYTVALRAGDAVREPAATIVADALDVCRVAARRLPADQLDALVEGDRDLAGLVLAGLDALARD
jgi:uncharacterized protein (TIGR03083 family)